MQVLSPHMCIGKPPRMSCQYDGHCPPEAGEDNHLHRWINRLGFIPGVVQETMQGASIPRYVDKVLRSIFPVSLALACLAEYYCNREVIGHGLQLVFKGIEKIED